MSSNKQQKNQQYKGKPVERRKFIWQSVQRRRIISLEDVRTKFPGASNQLIKDDIAFLNDFGIDIQSVPDQTDRRKCNLIDAGARHTETKAPRSKLFSAEKRLVGSLVTGLICGLPPYLPSDLQSDAEMEAEEAQATIRVPSEFEEIPSIKRIRSMLLAPPQSGNAKKVLKRLENFWREMNRGVVIDAGTTNDQTINRICNLDLPTSFSPLASLTVCTNSREMFQLLGEASVDAKVIMIGGEQVNRTDAVAGRLAELFMKSAGVLSFGLGIVGTTMVNVHDMTLNSDSHEEASLKALMFQKSGLRICAFDHSKMTPNPVRSAYPFVSIDPQQIDILVTNHPPAKAPKEEVESFNLMINAFKEIGVSVLIAG